MGVGLQSHLSDVRVAQEKDEQDLYCSCKGVDSELYSNCGGVQIGLDRGHIEFGKATPIQPRAHTTS